MHIMYPRANQKNINMSKHSLIIEFKHATNSHDGAIFQLNAYFDSMYIEKLLDAREWDRGQMKLQRARIAIVHI